MHADVFSIKARARTREYQMVIRSARLLGFDAGAEMYYSHGDGDHPPKRPAEELWHEWNPHACEADRKQAMLFNAQMAYAQERASGFEEAMCLDMWDQVHSTLRRAA